jgi:Domain of unknown function (DUF4832)/Domain of unknown function (DUF4874)
MIVMNATGYTRLGQALVLAGTCFAAGMGGCSSDEALPANLAVDGSTADSALSDPNAPPSSIDGGSLGDATTSFDANGEPVTGAAFQPSTANLPNPGRGFYSWSGEDFVNAYDAGSVQRAYAAGYRLVMARMPLDNFRNSDFSATWLANLGTSFGKVRAAGMKVSMIFSYDFTAGGRDASAAQIKRHLEQLKPVLDANADVVAYMRAGFVGAWGEWHSSKSGNSCGYNAPANVSCASADASRIIIRDALNANIPATTQIGMRYPVDLRKWYPTAGAQNRFGLHNDCFLAGPSDTGTYEDQTLRPYVQALTANAAFGGETCEDGGDFPLRSSCTDILREGPLYHLAWLSADYAPTFLNAWRAGGCFEQVAASMGYRLQLDAVRHAQSASVGTGVNVDIDVRNVGWSKVFGGARKLVVSLKNRTTGAVLSGSAGDLQTLPAQATGSTKLSVPVAIPSGAATGDYDVLVSSPDAFTSLAKDIRYSIRFANADNATLGQMWDAATATLKTGTSVKVR